MQPVAVFNMCWDQTLNAGLGGWCRTEKVAAAVTGLTDTQLRAAPVPVSGPLTDSQIRATPLPVSGTVAVTGTFWQATQPVSGTFWQATQPVSLASLPKAREDSAAMAWASSKTAAPNASAVQCDTGALAAGDYDFDINLAASDTVAVGKGLVVEHRNAANGATLQNLGGVPAGASLTLSLRRYTMATNERLRVIAGTAAGAASSMYQAAIGWRLA